VAAAGVGSGGVPTCELRPAAMAKTCLIGRWSTAAAAMVVGGGGGSAWW